MMSTREGTSQRLVAVDLGSLDCSQDLIGPAPSVHLVPSHAQQQEQVSFVNISRFLLIVSRADSNIKKDD